ncbi:MAG: hypothetical protein F2921_04230 [Actinobacteria bacterium]|nr:hypothetical protein [Actinomycetota bacterium]
MLPTTHQPALHQRIDWVPNQDHLEVTGWVGGSLARRRQLNNLHSQVAEPRQIQLAGRLCGLLQQVHLLECVPRKSRLGYFFLPRQPKGHAAPGYVTLHRLQQELLVLHLLDFQFQQRAHAKF